MKKIEKNEWIAMIGDIYDKFIDEADPAGLVSTKPKRKKERRKMTRKGRYILAACLSLFLLFSCAVLFIPYGDNVIIDNRQDISAYEGSRYYHIIDMINSRAYINIPHEYNNNFEMLSAKISKLFSGADGDISAMFPTNGETNGVNSGKDSVGDGNKDSVSNGGYVEVTDNQVKDVTEADLIKRSERYIFYLDSNTLKVFDINGSDSRQIGSYTIPLPDSTEDFFDGTTETFNKNLEFYLSTDCKTVTIISEYYFRYTYKTNGRILNHIESDEYVRVLSLDVSDPGNIKLIGKTDVNGCYITSRITNGKLLLISEKAVSPYSNIDFKNESEYLPQIDKGEGFESLPPESIDIPQATNKLAYTLMLTIDTQNMEMSESHAYMSHSQSPYITSDMIYLYHSFRDEDEFKDQKVTGIFTLIYALEYSNDSFETKGEIVLNGEILNRYSIDEYEGILRVVTTNMSFSRTYYSSNMYSSRYIQNSTNASLYCVDLENFEVISSVKRFAPDGEGVYSVRFDRKNAYVCTATVLLDDPVFFFDLSDINNITYKKTDVIPGYSSSLVDFGDGLLLGIGENENRSLKIEIYKETPDKVIPICKYEPGEKKVYFSKAYKSYYIDRENSLVGLGIYICNDKYLNRESRYVVLHLDGSELIEVVNEELNGNYSNRRGVYIDGYFYMFGENDFKVVPLDLNDPASKLTDIPSTEAEPTDTAIFHG